MKATHAKSPIVDGYTLCHVTHDRDGPAKMAKPGERVNCPSCRVVVHFCRTFNEQYREVTDGR